MNLILDEDLLAIHPPDRGVEEILTYTYKESVYDPSVEGGIRIDTKRIPVFDYLKSEGKVVGLQTHSGFIDKVRQYARDRSIHFSEVDLRQPLPKARLDLMHGFRFSQRSLLTKALIQDRSGLIGAPTRYGKSWLMLNIIRAYPTLRIAVLAPGADLIKQNYSFLKENLRRHVAMIGGGTSARKTSEHVTVCSMDSIHKLDADRIDLVIIDEPHALVTPQRADSFLRLMRARKIGLGATLSGRFDGRDIYIIGLIGPVLSQLSFKEAVREGAVCPVHVLMMDYELDVIKVSKKDTAYKRLFYEHPRAAKMIKYICREIIPEQWQTLGFIKNERHGEYLKKETGVQALIMAKKCNRQTRELYNTLMAKQILKRVLATKIYSTGVTFSHLRVMINAEGGGAGISAVQKGGRLAEVREGKACGILFDFNFRLKPAHLVQTSGRAWEKMVRDSQERKRMYKDLGYEVHTCRNVEEAKKIFDTYAYGN